MESTVVTIDAFPPHTDDHSQGTPQVEGFQEVENCGSESQVPTSPFCL